MSRELEQLSIEFQHLCLKQETLPCTGQWETFYPDEIMDWQTKRIAIQAAKALCGDCPIREQCLEFALANNEAYGIWGGLTPQERNSI